MDLTQVTYIPAYNFKAQNTRGPAYTASLITAIATKYNIMLGYQKYYSFDMYSLIFNSPISPTSYVLLSG